MASIDPQGTRVHLVPNHKFKRDAIKAYGHSLTKFKIIPTLAGPYLVRRSIA
jgi:hypothetical protein